MKNNFIIYMVCLVFANIKSDALTAFRFRKDNEPMAELYYALTHPVSKKRKTDYTEIPNCPAGTLCFDECPARVETFYGSKNKNPMTFDGGKTWYQNLSCWPFCDDVAAGNAPNNTVGEGMTIKTICASR
jgi:hypothetical protein